jgi:CRISPR-associated endoribonuclease Cas6
MIQTQNSSMTIDHSPVTIPNPTLYASVVKLVATTDGFIPATQGRLAHAAFLNLIQAVDPALAETLHVSKQRKPFTVSPLQGLGQAREGQVKVKAGQEVWLRFTLLGSELFATFTRFLLTPFPLEDKRSRIEDRGLKIENRQASIHHPRSTIHHLPTLRLGELEFTISEVLTTSGSHPWAGYVTLEQLQQALVTTAKQGTRLHEIKIHFASPTVFSLGDNKDGLGKRMEPFPTPKLFFSSLASIWREILPPSLTIKLLEEYVEKTVVIGIYDMRSCMYRFWKQPQIGAEGTVTYILRDRAHPQMTQLLNLLAELGFYSGVGAKTTMGMGQIRRIL